MEFTYPHDVQVLERLFVQLALLPSSPWAAHVQALVSYISSTDFSTAVSFLEELWGAPPEAMPRPAVQTVALQEWTRLIVSSGHARHVHDENPAKTPAKKPATEKKSVSSGRGDCLSMAVVAALPRLLCVLGHEDARVRAIACSSVKLLADTCDTWWAPSAPARDRDLEVEREPILAVLRDCADHVDRFQTGSEAAETYLRSLLSRQDAVGSARGRGARKGGANQQQASGFEVDHQIDPSTAQAFCAFLLSQLPRLFGSPARLNAVPFVVNSIHDACGPADLLNAALLLLREFALCGSPPVLGPLKTGLERRVAIELLRLFNDRSLATMLAGPHASGLVDSLLGLLRVPAADGTEDVRQEALRAITPTLFEAISLEDQRRALFVVSIKDTLFIVEVLLQQINSLPCICFLQALMTASARDHNDVCRSAAQKALSLIPLSSELLRPLLTVAAKHTEGPSKTPALRRRKILGGKEISNVGNHDAVVDGEGFRTCLATLEVLQWKAEDVPDVERLVDPLQIILRDLLSTAVNAVQDSDTVEGTNDDAEANTVSQAARAYAMQLALAVLHVVAQRHNTNAVNVFDIDVALRCAQQAPDSTVRSTALTFVGALAAVDPPAVLKHALEIVAVIKDASSGGELLDSHSTNAAASTLEAVASAWVRGGGDAGQLITAVVEAVSNAPPQRRLSLVRALAGALPEDSGPWMVALGLLERGLIKMQDSEEVPATMEIDLATALVLQVSFT